MICLLNCHKPPPRTSSTFNYTVQLPQKIHTTIPPLPQTLTTLWLHSFSPLITPKTSPPPPTIRPSSDYYPSLITDAIFRHKMTLLRNSSLSNTSPKNIFRMCWTRSCCQAAGPPRPVPKSIRLIHPQLLNCHIALQHRPRRSMNTVQLPQKNLYHAQTQSKTSDKKTRRRTESASSTKHRPRRSTLSSPTEDPHSDPSVPPNFSL